MGYFFCTTQSVANEATGPIANISHTVPTVTDVFTEGGGTALNMHL